MGGLGRPTAPGRVRDPSGSIENVRVAALGHAITVQHHGAGQSGLQPQQRVRSQRRAAQNEALEAGEIGRFEPGMVDEELSHGRHHEGDHRSFLFDDLEPSTSVEFWEVENGGIPAFIGL